ncbi:hypothetical protein CASFOL_015484 [Castilleja foliolosa]|uniref:Glycosyltransferase n=1 Tax=Castilleja foliolosa TaxID=1961234 RepID=A0ABD3DFW9_9LAMI
MKYPLKTASLEGLSTKHDKQNKIYKMHDLAYFFRHIQYYICKSSSLSQHIITFSIAKQHKMNQTEAHILVVTCPFQGHAAPLMKLSHQITKLGTKVTFLTIKSANLQTLDESKGPNKMLSINLIPDGLELGNGQKNPDKLLESAHRVIPGYLEDLLKKSNQSGKYCDRITGCIIDSPLAWMMVIPKKMGIKVASFWVSNPGCLALGLKIPHLIEDKIIDSDGTPINQTNIKLLPNMPDMTTPDLLWYFPGDTNVQKSIFHVIKATIHHMVNADWILCNWFHELDPSANDLTPNILSVGPLLAAGQSSGSLFSEDSTCLTWLDKQPKNSVVYVAFGSTSKFSPQQLDELTNGLELMGRPFLWVAFSGLNNGSSPVYSEDFIKRVGDRGKIVEWAPQEAVLGHPSVACFVTHCGWSSFMESLSMGVPLVCWPYFADQMYTKTCVCDGWRVGVWLKGDEDGVVRRDKIKEKVDEVLCDAIIRENALKLKEMAMNSITEKGRSMLNLEYLVEQMKG